MDNRFTTAPTIEQPRSKFMRNSTHKTTFNSGKLVPIYVDEVLPGDTFNINMSGVVRASTPKNPVMDAAYLDTYAFFIPNRLVWDGWEQFMGENKESFWIQTNKKTIPQVGANGNFGIAWGTGSIADHMGLPVDRKLSVSALPFRAYCLVWNEFFRDQNVQKPIHIDKGDGFTANLAPHDQNVEDFYEDAISGGTLAPVNKYHDYFTSCLPGAQKAADVLLPIYGDNVIPVVSGTTKHPQTHATTVQAITGTLPGASTQGYEGVFLGTNQTGTVNSYNNKGSGTVPGEMQETNQWAFNNLEVDITGTKAAKINDLRLAFQMQRALERDARSGTRYTEMIEAHFGVSNPDARLQRPEFLGGAHTQIQQTQVEQTTSGDGTKFNENRLGSLAAYSLTNMQENMALKSFTEHGHVIIFAAVRHEQTYQDCVERMWSRKERFEHYHPVFANLGEQKVMSREIYAAAQEKDVFGFQEAWAEYRYKPSKVSGDFVSRASTGSLDSWHYANRFTSQPSLNSKFMEQDPDQIDRTIILNHNTAPQFIADFYIQNETTRTMPLYSVPGLIDHN